MLDWKNPDFLPLISARNDRLMAIKSTPGLLSACYKHYENNPVDFINDWVWTYDPRQKTPFMPMVLFKKQADLVNWLYMKTIDKEDGLIEKTRDVGITWVCCAFAAWAWLFKDGIKISFGSRKEKLVDELGNIDSIFEKIRVIFRYLPNCFLPKYQDQLGSWMGYREDKDATFMRIINRKTNAMISGEAGDNIGRGGRSTMYFLDEFAFLERQEKVEAAVSSNSDVKIYLSTYNGNGNLFYRKRISEAIPVFSFAWRDDPRKDDEWYAKQQRNLEPHILAQEVDMDPNASVEGICIKAEWVQACVDFHIKNDIELTGDVEVGLDVANEGGDLNSEIHRKGIGVIYWDGWKEGTTGESMLRCYLQAELQGATIIKYDNIGVGAGTKSKAKEITESKTNAIPIIGINAGSTKFYGEWEPGKKNVDMFLNMKALMWWTVRRRIKKTYEYVTGQENHDIEELISLPNHPTLLRELSQPKHWATENGKMRIEPKDQLLKRGIKSTNFADALMLAYAPRPNKISGVW